MSRRFAALYSDGSLGVEPSKSDLETARKRLIGSSDDEDTEIVEVEIKIMRSHGKPKLRVVRENSLECPCCGEEIFYEVPNEQA